jgi:bilirubin oxidase
MISRGSIASTAAKRNPLAIPELYEGEPGGGIRRFRLTAQSGKTRFSPTFETSTIGYNGSYLGPTLRVKKGDRISIEVTNKLDEDTTVHWHGMILPARMDGGPHQVIRPGQQWHSEFEIKQKAATLFYHSHAHGNTGQQVYRGLAGMLLIDDDESAESGLPADYGIDDIPLIIQDRDFSNNGEFRYVGFMPEQMVGKHGKTLLVNGGISPVLKARKSLLRLRLLNASNARFYRLVFSDNRSFQVVASDGGLLERPVNVNLLDMAPAERYEILVDVADGKSVMLQSLAGVGNSGHGPMRMMGMNIPFDVLLIDASQAKKSTGQVARQLTSHTNYAEAGRPRQRRVELQMGMMGGVSGGMMGLNGRAFNMQRIDFTLKKNSLEYWELINRTPLAHPFHVHNTQFRIVNRNNTGPFVQEVGYKDTVIVRPSERVGILIPTGPYSDNKNPYMYHCHILEHEDGGMMGQFVVAS